MEIYNKISITTIIAYKFTIYKNIYTILDFSLKNKTELMRLLQIMSPLTNKMNIFLLLMSLKMDIDLAFHFVTCAYGLNR